MNATQGAIQPSSTWLHPATEVYNLHLFEVVLPPIHSSHFQFFHTKHRLPSLCSFTSRLSSTQSSRSWETWNVGWWLSDSQSNKLNQTIELKGLNCVVSQKFTPGILGYGIHSRPYIAWTKGFSPASCWPPGNVTLQLLLFQTDMEQDFEGFPGRLHKLSNKNPGHLLFGSQNSRMLKPCKNEQMIQADQQLSSGKLDQKMTNHFSDSGFSCLGFSRLRRIICNQPAPQVTVVVARSRCPYSVHPWQHCLRLGLWPLCYCTTSSFKHLCTN